MGKLSKAEREKLVKEELAKVYNSKTSAFPVKKAKLSKSEKRRQKLENLSQLSKSKSATVETIVFENPDVLSREQKSQKSKKPRKVEEAPELDLKAARYEIMKFGMSKMSSEDFDDAQTKLCIKLGAYPEKKEYVNYKTLVEKKKQEKLNAVEEIPKPKIAIKSAKNSKSNRSAKKPKAKSRHAKKK